MRLRQRGGNVAEKGVHGGGGEKSLTPSRSSAAMASSSGRVSGLLRLLESGIEIDGEFAEGSLPPL